MTLPDFLDTLALFTPLDAAALVVLALAWILVGHAIENLHRTPPSVSVLMTRYRREWMHNVIAREPRVSDAMIVTSLRQGTAFFASTAMIALGSGLALVPNIDRLSSVASELALGQPTPATLKIRLILSLAFVANAFLKFVWSHRVFGYCTVVMGAIPNDREGPLADHRADQAADLQIAAAWAFNRGLRSVYFALCTLAWLLGPVPLMLATVFTVMLLWQREFLSNTHRTLMAERPALPDGTGRPEG